jgi:5-methyltetrahydropteroyltriglutamate--homocysteine methyltransferase
MGADRELKRALENHWTGDDSSGHALMSTAAELRSRHRRLQRDRGIDRIPSNDFSLYDHVLDTAAMVGAVPVQLTRFAAHISPGRQHLHRRI